MNEQNSLKTNKHTAIHRDAMDEQLDFELPNAAVFWSNSLKAQFEEIAVGNKHKVSQMLTCWFRKPRIAIFRNWKGRWRNTWVSQNRINKLCADTIMFPIEAVILIRDIAPLRIWSLVAGFSTPPQLHVRISTNFIIIYSRGDLSEQLPYVAIVTCHQTQYQRLRSATFAPKIRSHSIYWLCCRRHLTAMRVTQGCERDTHRETRRTSRVCINYEYVRAGKWRFIGCDRCAVGRRIG